MSNNFFAALDDDDDPPIVVPSKATPAPVPASSGHQKEQRRPNNNDRNTKHGRGGREPGRGGKRAYDRRSGTGRGKEIKKDGGGARNWGSDKNEARKNEGTVVESKEGEVAAVEGDKPSDAEAEPEPVVEEEDNTLTLDEYLQKKALPDSVAFKPIEERKVQNEFGNLTPRVAQEEDFLVMGGGKKERVRNKTKEKQVVVASFKVASSEPSDERREGRGGRGRGDRGGRGRGRGRDGGRGRGDGRGRGGRGDGRGRGRTGGGGGASQINTMDPNAFPTLG